MPYCTSCGMPIPEGQGHSCSMCYGDPAWGHDGYYQDWLEEQMIQELRQQEVEQQPEPESEQKKEVE